MAEALTRRRTKTFETGLPTDGIPPATKQSKPICGCVVIPFSVAWTCSRFKCEERPRGVGGAPHRAGETGRHVDAGVAAAHVGVAGASPHADRVGGDPGTQRSGCDHRRSLPRLAATAAVIALDAGALLRLVGLIPGEAPEDPELYSTDGALCEVIGFLREHFAGNAHRASAVIAELQSAVQAFPGVSSYAWAAVELACVAPADLPVTTLSPIAFAAEARMPFVTISRELAEIAAGQCSEVRYLAP